MKCDDCESLICIVNDRAAYVVNNKPVCDPWRLWAKSSRDELMVSARNGCDLCNLILEAIEIEGARIVEGELSDEPMKLSNALTQDDFHLAIRRDRSSNRSRQYTFESPEDSKILGRLRICADPDTIAAKATPFRSVPVSPRLEQSVGQVIEWIVECDHHHSCNATELPFLPTRVLDLGPTLPVLKTKGYRAKYVALSYCWGLGGNNLELTRSTIPGYTSHGIPLNHLPKTIQDAIFITKKIGVQYLWVDALCIIQKEAEDFKIEAPKMSEYYSNAYLTIVAGSASDCGDGFLNNRSLSEAAPCELKYSTLYSDRSSKLDDLGAVHLCLVSKDDYAPGPVTTRAWTFQESELSRRLLTYGPRQASFKCQDLHKFENGRVNDVKNEVNFWNDTWQDQSPSTTWFLYKTWHDFVGDYTARTMTRDKDKLAAIAGITNRVQKLISSKYLYGLWAKYLIDDLQWSTTNLMDTIGPKSLITRDDHRAPSWSWASINGNIWRTHDHCFGWASIKRNKWRTHDEINSTIRCQIKSHANIPGHLDPINELGLLHYRENHSGNLNGKAAIPTAFELHLQGCLHRCRGVLMLGHPGELYNIYLCDSLSKNRQDSIRSNGTGYLDTGIDEDTIEAFALVLSDTRGLLLQHADGKRFRRVGIWYGDASENLACDHDQVQDIVLI